MTVFATVLFIVAMLGLVADIIVLRHARRLVAKHALTGMTGMTVSTLRTTKDSAAAADFMKDADITVDVPPMTMEESARNAVAEIGLTGADAERMYAGIMEGIKRAKEAGHDGGTIAISMQPGIALTPLDIKLMPKLPGHKANALRPIVYNGVVDDDDKLVS